MIRMLGPIATLLILFPAAAQDDAAKKDLEAIQGSWKMVSASGARPEELELLPKFKVQITKDRIAFSIEGKELVWTVRLDPAANPKTIDATVDVEGGKTETAKGIYSLEKDELRICMGDRERPKEFKAVPGNAKIVLFILKREKP